ncbi:MAG: electron transfer flavoprotein subunit alpha [Armatimonadetes bacterium]|nr:electron transfer flavoprotein subunit alpha [Armatimonadota bacterium]
MSIKVDPTKCNGCTLCVKACPVDAIEVKDKLAVIDLDKCTLCSACVSACRFKAISIEVDKQPAEDLQNYKDVWVFGEQRDGKVAPVVFELINVGRQLADDRSSELSVIILGDNLDEAVADLASYPVDKVYVYEAPELEIYDSERYCRVLTDVMRDYKPEIVLAGATTTGRSFMSGVAIRLYTGLTADCTGLEIGEDGLLHQTRPAYGGNIMATILCPYTRPQMATVRHKVFPTSAKRCEGEAEIIRLTPKPALFGSRSKFVDFVETVGEQGNLVDADIIISGGRGLGGPEGSAPIRELADELGAAVGASRAAVDAGWIPYAHQVGQTGKTVCPKIYIACGISGAVQHQVGLKSSDVIIAINRDPNAPVFDIATHGFVGDIFEVLPALTKKIKALRGAPADSCVIQ